MELAPLLGDIPPARLFDEMLKLFMGGCALGTFEALRHYNLFGQLFPLTEQTLTHEEQHFPLTLISHVSLLLGDLMQLSRILWCVFF